ncbi:UbiD family decarboxylase [Mycobacterium paraterrae]|uniref:Pyrrole-2-carboxylic acid decarboxylase n=1 Tax=Mycobacterium paraterrae TaxID=577492 RepID=A0ABY3VK08_9MYCO|nr:UbiD family decarboxylase [Mycobacterium paraterrae]UMB69749.1 UbiD family decarboxylase [Mycobacterium paraterrae]
MGSPAPSRYTDPGFTPQHLKDLREFITALREHGDLVEIDEPVDWNLEIGAIIRHVLETGAPAPLFNRINDSQPGFRVLGAPGGVSALPGRALIRAAIALGLPVTATGTDIVEALSRVVDAPPIAPRIVDNAPFQANIVTGDDIDLFALPTPLIHCGDGDRFINTFGTIVAPHPDGEWTNWSISRIALRDKNTMVGLFQPMQHLGQIFGVWKERGENMPFALSLGQEPVVPYFAGAPLPDHISEAGAIGAYLKKPIDVVKAHTNDLHVPASSEIVIEGWVSIEETALEGPMSEYPGYLLPAGRSAKPVYHVTAISHRDNAILPVVAAGYPAEEDHTVWGISNSAVMLADLRKHDFPVTGVYLPFQGANHLLVITVPINWRELSGITSRHEFAHKLGLHVMGTKPGMVAPRILVVEDDVDPTDDGDVLWALSTRVHPVDDTIFIHDQVAVPLIVYLTSTEKRSMSAAKAILVGLHRDEWTEQDRPVKADFWHNFPAELRHKVLGKWTTYGYPAPS